VNFISTGDIYKDFHLQTLDIHVSINRGVASFQNVYFVDRIGLVGCAQEFLGRLGLWLGLRLGPVYGYKPVDMIFKYVCVPGGFVYVEPMCTCLC